MLYRTYLVSIEPGRLERFEIAGISATLMADIPCGLDISLTMAWIIQKIPRENRKN
jgi:hypothetical protein